MYPDGTAMAYRLNGKLKKNIKKRKKIKMKFQPRILEKNVENLHKNGLIYTELSLKDLVL